MDILGDYRWLVRKLREILDNYSSGPHVASRGPSWPPVAPRVHSWPFMTPRGFAVLVGCSNENSFLILKYVYIQTPDRPLHGTATRTIIIGDV